MVFFRKYSPLSLRERGKWGEGARILLLCLCFFLLSCAPRDPDVRLIKAASVCPPDNPIVRMTQFLSAEVLKRSGGRLKIEIYDSGRLGGETDNIERVRLNTLELSDVSTSVMSNFVPEFRLFDLPFLFDDAEHQKRVLDGEVGRDLLRTLERAGMKGLAFYGGSARNLYTKVPLRSIDDVKGMKIRIMESRVLQQTINAFGACAIPLSFTELFSALEQGVVDGAENNPIQYCVSGHSDVCPYYTLTGHFMIPSLVVMPLKFWNSLSENDRRLFDQAVADSRAYFESTWKSVEQETYEKLRKSGVQVNTIDKVPFRAAVKPIYDDYVRTFGDHNLRIIDSLRTPAP